MTTKKIILSIVSLLVLAGLVWAGIFWWNNLRGVGPAIKSPSGDIVEIIENNNKNVPGENATDFPLTLPDNFKIEVFAENLPGARVIVRDGQGNFWVSQTKQGIISLLTVEDGKVTGSNAVFRNLDRPHGLAIDPQNGTTLYYAETGGVYRVPLYTEASPEKLVDLPAGGGHFTRTIAFGPDGRLYVSIGSTCNVCNEDDERRAAIYSMNRDGSDFKKHADGLRNSVFFDWSYVDGRMWATEMGRDRLGDDIPPDEINIIEEGANYGWPICYGKGIHDTSFDKNQYVRNPCEDTIPSYIDLQAHSAPLGLAFVPEEGWPEGMWYDLLVAYHGSWNRTVPTGYKIMRLKLDAEGNFEGREDFVSGWLQGGSALGKPVDIHIEPGGVMYITDDHAGVVYRVSYLGE
ncbi:MAG: PQQ-dependent sugar dehydrogenase [Candidatus Spechtbacterales bacterium]